MNPPTEVLYALPSNLYAEQPGYVKTAPVVRYSDHCAERERLLKQIHQLTATCERLQAELTAQKYNTGVAELIYNEINKQPTKDATRIHVHGGDTGHSLPEKVVGRWDGKPKAL